MLSKLQEALAEIEQKQRELSAAADVLRKLLGEVDSPPQERRVAAVEPNQSYVDVGVGILNEIGKPIRQRDLAERIHELYPDSKRVSIESSLFRHIEKAKNKKIVRIGRGIGLPDWKQPKEQQPSLIHMPESA